MVGAAYSASRNFTKLVSSSHIVIQHIFKGINAHIIGVKPNQEKGLTNVVSSTVRNCFSPLTVDDLQLVLKQSETCVT